MKDIKELYENAKNGKSYDITKYEEAVKELMESNPLGYVNALEYIISSSIGLGTLNKFNERYGISVASYDIIMEALNNAITKCRQKAIDASVYNEHVEALEQYKLENYHCFNMYDEYKTRMPAGYLMEYYRYPKGAISNDSLNKIVSRYGEAAIPDLILKYNKEGNLNSLIKYLEKPTIFSSPSYNQWILECVMPLESSIKNSSIYKKSLSGIVESCSVRTNQLFNEAAIVGSNDEIEYTEAEVNAIKELILFKEYMVTCETSGNAMKVLQEVYSLYEEFGSVLEDVGDNIAPMLPRAEAGLLDNSKATGNAPGYLSKNHNLSYGEDENSLKKKRRSSSYDYLDDDDDDEYLYTNRNKPASKAPNTNLDIVDTDDLETYKRPSANTNVPDADVEELKDEIKDAKTPAEKQQAINNYYYYTYKNSFNKKGDDRSIKVDDHSSNKRISSDNIKNDKEDVVESLNDIVIDFGDAYNEGFKDVFDKVKGFAKALIKRMSGMKILRTPSDFRSADHQVLSMSIKKNGPTKIDRVLIVGSNLVAKVNSDGTVTTEKVSEDSDEEDNLFTESMDNNRLSEIFTNFCKKNSLEYVIVGDNTKLALSLANFGGLAVLMPSESQFKELKETGDISDYNLNTIRASKNPVLALAPSSSDIFKNLSEELFLNTIQHEQGHMLTLSKFSNKDFSDYSIRHYFIKEIMNYFNLITEPDYDIIVNATHHSFAIEKAANDAAGVDSKKILEAAFNKPLPSNWKSSAIFNIVSFPISYDIIKIYEKSMNNQDLSPIEHDKLIRFSIEVYKKCAPESIRNQFIKTLEVLLSGTNKSYKEAVDPDDDKPTSSLQDLGHDIDRTLGKVQQGAKKVVQGVVQTGSIFLKPFRRTAQWVSAMVNKWRDADENNIKEKLADPNSRKGIFNAIKTAVVTGALFRAGLLLNPIFLFLAITRRIGKGSRESRLRNEMITELKTEIEVIDEKIRDADRHDDNKAKYQLMRLKNEINKKLLRVGVDLKGKGNII